MMNQTESIQASYRVIVLEDNPLYAATLKNLLETLNCEILAVVASVRAGMQAIRVHKPDIVITDFALTDGTAFTLARRVKHLDRKIKVFLLTAHTEHTILNFLIKNPHLDAIGLKTSAYHLATFPLVLAAISREEFYLDPAIVQQLKTKDNMPWLATLTPKEIEILLQAISGKSSSAIAEAMSVSCEHVRNFKSKVNRKIKVKGFKETQAIFRQYYPSIMAH